MTFLGLNLPSLPSPLTFKPLSEFWYSSNPISTGETSSTVFVAYLFYLEGLGFFSSRVVLTDLLLKSMSALELALTVSTLAKFYSVILSGLTESPSYELAWTVGARPFTLPGITV